MPDFKTDETWQPWPDLATLMDQAKAEGLWFRSNYQDLWFSPAELQVHWDKGEFRWGACNWELRKPTERAEELAAERDAIERQRLQFIERLSE